MVVFGSADISHWCRGGESLRGPPEVRYQALIASNKERGRRPALGANDLTSAPRIVLGRMQIFTLDVLIVALPGIVDASRRN